MVVNGTHDGNLITNQSYVGMTRAEVSGQTFINTQFKNYLKEPISITKAKVRVTDYYGTREITINDGDGIQIGHRDGGAVRGEVHIENSEIYVTFENSTSERIISTLGNIEYLELETQERTYNEFKFQN